MSIDMTKNATLQFCKVVFLLRTANAALPPNKNASVFIRLGCASKFPHLRDLFRPDARNFPRRREAGFGDVRRIFAFFIAQICAVQISGVIIEKSRRSCCLSRSPWLFTGFHLEEFHGADRKTSHAGGSFVAFRGW